MKVYILISHEPDEDKKIGGVTLSKSKAEEWITEKAEVEAKKYAHLGYKVQSSPTCEGLKWVDDFSFYWMEFEVLE